MAWRDADQAFTVFDLSGTRISTDPGSIPTVHTSTWDVGLGSTGTVSQSVIGASHGRFGSVGVARPLRTFVVPDPKLVGVNLADPIDPTDPTRGFQPHPDYPVQAPNPDVIGYFETRAGSGPTLGGGSGLGLGVGFAGGVVHHHEVNPPATAPSVRSFPILPTGVVRQLRTVDPTTRVVSEAVSTVAWATGTVSPASQTVAFGAVALQDPQVTRVPAGVGGSLAEMWLMVLTRQRLISGVDSNSRATAKSLNDIVLYVSDNATFSAPVGPFLVVDSLNALEAFGTGGYPFRVWCSVPSVAVDDDALLICFMAEASTVDVATLPDSGADASGYTGGPAMVRVALADLEVAVLSGATSEAGWEATYTSRGTCGAVVPFTALGPVGLWVYDPDSLGFYEEFLTRFPGVKAADPAVVVANGVVFLFFAVLRDDAGANPADWATADGTTYGQGLWRGADFSALPTSELGFGRFRGTRGVDFLLRCASGLTEVSRADAPDLVRASNEEEGFVADPDPFELPDGRWLVFAGRASIFGAAGPSPYATCATIGDAADALGHSNAVPVVVRPLPRPPHYWNP